MTTPREAVARHFEGLASAYDAYKQRAWFYYEAVTRCVADVVPPGRAVLDAGCGTGDVLAALRPSRGVGVDVSPTMVELAARKHPQLDFRVHDLLDAPLPEQFDSVVAVDLVEHVPELDVFFRSAAAMVAPRGRLVVVTANPLWAPVLWLAERLRRKMPEGDHSWRSRAELELQAAHAGLRLCSFDRFVLVPRAVPVLARVNNARWAAPLRRRLGLVQRAVFVHGRGGSATASPA